MAAVTEQALPRRSLRELLAAELAPREGRLAVTVRMALACTAAVMVAMVFRIPLPAYMAYIVFLISKEHRTATLTATIGGFVAANIAILLTFALFLVDLSEPALRLPLMALATFAAMFTSRTFALGPVTFLAGFVLVNLQTVVDDIPSPEALTHLVLWLWVVAAVPVAITLGGELLAGQSTRTLIRRTLVRILDRLAVALQVGTMPAELADWRDQVVALLPLARRASDLGKDSDTGLISAQAVGCVVDALLLLALWPKGPQALEPQQEIPAAVRECLATRVRFLRDVIAAERFPEPAASGVQAAQRDLDAGGADLPPVALGLTRSLDRLERALRAVARRQPDGAEDMSPRAERRLFVPDAFSNPAHLQFALKTTLAVMLVYILYTLLDWPGVRTSVVTCFFVALGSLGETMHKLVLRISGALIGGLLAGLCIVFLLPALTDIGQLAVLTGIVAAGCAWVATSSERLSYAGLQIAFAFFLGLLQSYGPTTDLTVLRDRVAGILIGNVVIAIVFSFLWPESAVTRVRASLAQALRGVAGMLRSPALSAQEPRLETIREITAAHKYLGLAGLELQMLPGQPQSLAPLAQVAAVTELAGAALLAVDGQLTRPIDSEWLLERARWLEAAAQRAERMQAPSPPPPDTPPAEPSESQCMPDTRLIQNLLQQRIEHAAAQLA